MDKNLLAKTHIEGMEFALKLIRQGVDRGLSYEVAILAVEDTIREVGYAKA